MGLFSFVGNLIAGRQGAKLGKKQMGLGQQMIDEAQALSAAYERPELSIERMMTPEAINAMTSLAYGRQYKDMPGMTMAQNRIGETTASVLDAIKEMGIGSEGFGAVGDIYSKSLKEKSNLAIQNALFKDKAEQDYMGALQTLGEYENKNFLFNTDAAQKEFEWNQAMPYMNAQQKASMLETMGRQGQWEGLKTKMGSWAESFKGMGGALDQTVGQLANVVGGGLGKILGVIGG